MAQRGSVWVMAVNSLAACAYQNEWRTATAWSNDRWVSAAHEVARWTVPTSSAETGDTSATTKPNTSASSVDIAEAPLSMGEIMEESRRKRRSPPEGSHDTLATVRCQRTHATRTHATVTRSRRRDPRSPL